MAVRTNDHQKYLQRAHELALANVKRNTGGPFGAVIVCRGRVCAEAKNGVTRLNDPTAHAEIQAIRKACRKRGSFDLSDCVLYASCEPCPMCLAAILWARIPVVYFGNTRVQAAKIGFDDERFYRALARPQNIRGLKKQKLKLPTEHVAFDAWKTSIRKIRY